MAGQKKFGAFGGVFTPSILTILGVIMYLRMGWVVGNAGLVGTIIIVLIAHVISISTGLSVSSIATDKKVGAGGIYYILSRSMGIPIGGSIGITLYVGTAFSIALYLIGFAESFNGYFMLPTDINGLRITGSIALLMLTAIALISTAVALKTQFFILTAIVLSLVSIFLGTAEFAPQTINLFSTTDSVPLEVVFAIFFPAVTGFTAGVAMSGDLENPKKSIPIGTMLAIAVGLVVYIALAFFLSYNVDSELLKSDNNILMKISMYAPLVVAGVWGATLSSALGGILGGPRILQAMSLDKVTPRIFGKGKGKENEPVNALILVYVIAQAGILIGELEVIARVVSMFYLAAYGFINMSFFLEGWANPDFQPTFKVKRWFGFVGFIASFGVMFKLDMVAMFASFIVIGGVYFWLHKKQIQLQSGDVWQSVWENIVIKGLKKLEAKKSVKTKWNPNILLFSGDSSKRTYLLEFSKLLSGRTGIVTNFDLVKKTNGTDVLSKKQQTITDKVYKKLNIFGRKVEVDDLYDGIENIATTFGFSGIDPNTVMMGWARNTNDPIKYATLTKSLGKLDYNLLYLDYNSVNEYGSYKTIDLWWRESDSNNAEMMLNISRFITQNPKWGKAVVRVLFVNHNNANNFVVRTKINRLLQKLRVEADVLIINNGIDQNPFYDIIERKSKKTDLVILGIPEINEGKNAEFVGKTNKLLDFLGTTLLVKASNNFNDLSLEFKENKVIDNFEAFQIAPLLSSKSVEITDLVTQFDKQLLGSINKIVDPALTSISSSYYHFFKEMKDNFDSSFKHINLLFYYSDINSELQSFLEKANEISLKFKKSKLSDNQALLDEGIRVLMYKQNSMMQKCKRRVKVDPFDKRELDMFETKTVIKWRMLTEYYYGTEILPQTQSLLYDFGESNYTLINKFQKTIVNETQQLLEQVLMGKNKTEILNDYKNKVNAFFEFVLQESLEVEAKFQKYIRHNYRGVSNKLMKDAEHPDINSRINRLKRRTFSSDLETFKEDILTYSGYWLNNQELFHNQLESAFSLAMSSHSITITNSNIAKAVYNSVVVAQLHNAQELSEITSEVKTIFNKGKLDDTYTNKTLNDFADGMQRFSLGNLLEEREEEIYSVSSTHLDDVSLMNFDSISSFHKCQTDCVESVTVDLWRIQDYIIQSSYLSPLQKSISELEFTANKTNEIIYNTSNLLKHQIEELDKVENGEEIIKGFDEVNANIENIIGRIQQSYDSFVDKTNTDLHSAIIDLDPKSIVESLETLSQFAKNPGGTDFQKWLKNRKAFVYLLYLGLKNFFIQRKKNIDYIKFEKKYSGYNNVIEQASNFITSISINEKVSKKMTFYYVKLFSGSHLGLANSDSRVMMLDTAVNSINKIKSGVSGGIMTIGEASSGKTHFTETIAKSLLKGEKYHINPVANQNFDINDMHNAFRSMFDKKGTTDYILSRLEPGAILIFNNIERWWMKSTNGDKIINYLALMIEKHGANHYFLLNCNIYSFDIIRQTTNIEASLLSTIVMSPVNLVELSDIIRKRHRAAGGEILYSKRLVCDLKLKDSLYENIYSKSKGNVGTALNIWLSSIVEDEEGNLEIKSPKINAFPSIISPEWKLVLYQFILHDRISKKHIKEIFNKSEQVWVERTLLEMTKSNLIYKHSNNFYSLNGGSKYYVENWLKDYKILK
ncbi:MAG: amino acid permease [Ichthyobacteriaceae bacterium]|nr:amino acid permease [Ichthyobacteriaceae bacterium]